MATGKMFLKLIVTKEAIFVFPLKSKASHTETSLQFRVKIGGFKHKQV